MPKKLLMNWREETIGVTEFESNSLEEKEAIATEEIEET